MAADYGRFNGTPPGTARSQAHYEAFKSIPDAAMEDIIAASDHFTQTQYGLIPDPFTEKFDLTWTKEKRYGGLNPRPPWTSL